MTDLPLESVINPKGDTQPDYGFLIASCAIMCGVLVYEVVAPVYFSVLLVMGFVALMVSATPLYRQRMALMLIAFLTGAMASMYERHWHKTDLITQISDHKVQAVIADFELRDNRRARLWLRDLSIDGLPADALIRATIDNMPDDALFYGDKLTGALRLYPLSGPLFPDWPDYARKAWRSGIVASAYGKSPRITPAQQRPSQSLLMGWRNGLSNAITKDLCPTSATLAKALIIAERNFSDEAFHQPFRQAGLSHLLAISGLHMGLLWHIWLVSPYSGNSCAVI